MMATLGLYRLRPRQNGYAFSTLSTRQTEYTRLMNFLAGNHASHRRNDLEGVST